MNQNQTESKPENVEQPQDEGLDATICSPLPPIRTVEEYRASAATWEWAMGISSATERELADRLAALLQRTRDYYGGQIVDPECDCCECKLLKPVDEALATWKEVRSES